MVWQAVAATAGQATSFAMTQRREVEAAEKVMAGLEWPDAMRFTNTGTEATMQTEREAGLAYFFETPENISQCTWVYRTPTAIVNLPVKYELKDVPWP